MIDASLYYAGSIGYYWSAMYNSVNDIQAFILFLESGDYSILWADCFKGYSVRPVSD